MFSSLFSRISVVSVLLLFTLLNCHFMFEYPRFLVKDTDQFHPHNFPMLEDDIAGINAGIAHLPSTYKQEMLISFMKYNSINNDWVTVNPLLADAISTGDLPLSNIESLFSCSKNNPVFRKQMSEYLEQNLT
jgi:hypothetical protein